MTTSATRVGSIGKPAWRRAWPLQTQLAAAAVLLAVSACGPAAGSRPAKSAVIAPLSVAAAPAPKTLESTLRLDADADEIPFYPQIAESRYGDTVAVWEQFDGTRYNIWGNSKRAHQPWGRATLLETSDAGHAYNPQVAIGAQGRAMAVWVQADDAARRYDIRASAFDPQTGWSQPVQLGARGAGQAYAPQVASDERGNATAVWQQSDGRRFNIWGSRYRQGAGWGEAVQIEKGSTGLGAPTVAMDRDGHATALWPRFSGGKTEMWANRLPANGSWGKAARVESVAGYAYDPAIGIGAGGEVTASWHIATGLQTSTWAARYRLAESGLALATPCARKLTQGRSGSTRKCAAP